MKDTLVNSAIILGAAALTGVLGFGVYGYLRDTKGYSTWKAGAVTGLIGGGIGIGTALLGKKVGAFSGLGLLPRAYPTPLAMVPRHVASATLKGICPSCR